MQTLIIDKYFRIFKIRYEKLLVGSKFRSDWYYDL